MGRSRNISNTYNAPKTNSTYSEGSKSKGILDDYAVRGDVATKEGTIEHTPTNPKDIANKKYVDDNIGGVDWTVSQAPDVVHADNYTDTDTTDHTALSNIGTNTHAQIDTAITDVTLNTTDRHAQSHTVASHSDTSATGAELNTLTDGSDADALHTHDAVNILNPVGAITMYGASSAPTGWVNCDGASLLRAGTYANLFAVIGVTYGSADGTHFNVPDMKGAFPRGVGTSTKFTQDHTTVLGTAEDDSFQGHRHANKYRAQDVDASGSASSRISAHPGYPNNVYSATAVIFEPTNDGTNGEPRTGAETRPNNIGVNFIIKF